MDDKRSAVGRGCPSEERAFARKLAHEVRFAIPCSHRFVAERASLRDPTDSIAYATSTVVRGKGQSGPPKQLLNVLSIPLGP